MRHPIEGAGGAAPISSLEPTLPGIDNWLTAVGRLVLTFGSIEFLLDLLILQWTNDDLLAASALDLPFARRLTLLRKVIDRANLPETEAKNLTDQLRRIEEVSKVRNAIAHNPLFVVRVNSNRPDLGQFLGVPNLKARSQGRARLTPVVTPDELKEAIESLRKAAAALSSVLTLRPELSLQLEGEESVITVRPEAWQWLNGGESC